MSVSTNLLPANVSGIETDTSGWTAGANTAQARSTARFYLGVASLALTATAAGTVTATTSARVAVTAGQEYTAYAYFAGITAAAGRTATVRVDWYATVSGGTAISSVTSAGMALANSTAWNTPPPILISTAAVGAAYATVTISVTGIAAAGAVVVDAVGFGPPALIAGNLLPYNPQGVEVDTSGWTATTNAVIGRSGAVSFEGWYSMSLTSVAAGVMEVRQAALIPVTAGTEYFVSAWVQPAVTALEFRAQIQWYDASGIVVGTLESQSWVLSATTSFTRCAVIGTAPAGATQARIKFGPVATAAGQAWLIDQITFRTSPIPAGSLFGYNTQSMEVDASGWTAVSGCAISRSTDLAFEGAASLKIDSIATGTNAVVELADRVPVTPRQAYQVSPRLNVGLSASDRYVTFVFSWYSASGTLLSSMNLRWRIAPPGSTGWYSLPTSAVAPAGSATFSVAVRLESFTTGQPVYLDDVTLVPGGLAIIADPEPDMYGALISIQGLTTGGYATWGLWRTSSDGIMTPVRGSSGDLTAVPITGDIAIVEDYEAPLGQAVSYYLKVWTALPAYRATLSDSIVIPEPPPSEIILKDPGLPARQTTAVVAKGGAPTWTRKARQGINAIRGRARPIVISDVRTSREGTMTLVTETAQELADMWWLLETGNTLLIQWPSLWGERDAYVQIGDVTETPVVDYAEYSDRTWTVPLVEVDRPIGGSVGSDGRTWQTVNDDAVDWLAVMADATSWLDVYTGVSGG